MTLAEVLPEVLALSRADRLRLSQLVAEGLANEESMGLRPGMEFEVWSPFEAFEAAQTLQRVLAVDAQSA